MHTNLHEFVLEYTDGFVLRSKRFAAAGYCRLILGEHCRGHGGRRDRKGLETMVGCRGARGAG